MSVPGLLLYEKAFTELSVHLSKFASCGGGGVGGVDGWGLMTEKVFVNVCTASSISESIWKVDGMDCNFSIIVYPSRLGRGLAWFKGRGGRGGGEVG